MAEFKQVMHDWRRMCCAMVKDHGEVDACEHCPLEKWGCPPIYEDSVDGVKWETVERVVMAWAAENPESVYPSWMEYLLTQDGCKDAYNGGNDTLWKWMWTTPIPADKAERLGLKPKEDT